MILRYQQLLHLPVETISGLKLGFIIAFDVETEQQVVTRYYVRAGLLARPFASELIISASQVVSLTNEKMVVEEAVAPAALAATPAATA